MIALHNIKEQNKRWRFRLEEGSHCAGCGAGKEGNIGPDDIDVLIAECKMHRAEIKQLQQAILHGLKGGDW